MKKIIGLDINEVFRNFIETFHHFYEKEFNLASFDRYGEKISGYECEYYTNNLKEIFKFNNVIKKETVLVSDIDVYYSSKPKFNNNKHIIDKETAFNIFMYEDYLMELYGTCPKTYTHVGLDLNKIISKYGDNYIFKFIVKDKKITIPPTLFFLSTLRLDISEYLFVDSYKDIWDKCDIYITPNPDIYKEKPEGKEIIMVDMPYNKNLKIEKRISDINEILKKDLL